MSSLSRRFLRTAAVFLLAGLLLGLVLLVRRELSGRWPAPYLVSAHAHLVLVGGVLEMILGTALWLFPRPLKRADGTPPDHAGVATSSWWLLTAGTSVRAVAEIARAGSGLAGLRWAIVAGGTAQGLGLLCGVAALRTRVRAGLRVA